VVGGAGKKTTVDATLLAAERREFDVFVFWSLDCFSREGTRKTIHYL
jgi:hypothetical protein